MAVVDDERDPTEAVTPRASGTLQRAPIFAGLALDLCRKLRDFEGQCRLDRDACMSVSFRVELSKRMRAAEQLQATLATCADAFSSWAGTDPGDAIRNTVIHAWELAEREAKVLLALTAADRALVITPVPPRPIPRTDEPHTHSRWEVNASLAREAAARFDESGDTARALESRRLALAFDWAASDPGRAVPPADLALLRELMIAAGLPVRTHPITENVEPKRDKWPY